jgi:hypothetical protein
MAAAWSWGVPNLSRAERSGLVHRAKLYVWHEGKVMRRMPDGSTKQVPPPDQRELIEGLIS